MKYVIYARCSTEEQAKSGLGIDAQLHGCMKYIDAIRPGLQRLVFKDEGTSGKLPLAKRPVLWQAIESCTRGDVLLVLKRDRLGRKAMENAAIDHIVEKKGCKVVSVEVDEESMDPAMARFYRTMRDAMAEYEGAIISQRIISAMAVKKSRGEVVGRIPFGYRCRKVKESGKTKKYLEKCPIEQSTITAIRTKRDEGYSFRKILLWLNENDIRNRQGKPFGMQSLYDILNRKDDFVVRQENDWDLEISD